MGREEDDGTTIGGAMRTPQERLRFVLDGSEIIIWALDRNGIFIFSEGRGLRQLGIAPGQVVGLSVFDLYQNDAQALEEVKRCLSGEDFSAAQKVGDRVWQTTFRCLRDDKGRPNGATGVSIDITEQVAAEKALQSAHDDLERQVEERTRELLLANDELRQEIVARKDAEAEQRALSERLQQAERLEALGKLAGGVAHDFNNRLVSILGFAEVIEREATLERHRQYGRRIVRGAQRAARLTEQILAFARRGAFQSVVVNLHDLIDEALGFLDAVPGPKIAIEKVLRADPPTVRGDPSQLEDALINLICNARDAMLDGGQLTLKSEIAEPGGDPNIASLFGETALRYLKLTVTDTGVGMDSDTQKHIFDPFFTTKPTGEGTGMGLASVYGTISNHGGQILVESSLGNGASFVAYLPSSE